jgi:proteasome accessory factor C
VNQATRTTAADRMHRVLAEILWISERDGPTVAEAAERFGVSAAVLHQDLELASLIGGDSDDFLDMPVELYFEGDRVFVHLSAFDRPLRLSPPEALALVVAGTALIGATTEEGGGALGRALAKVAAVLDIEVGADVDVDLGIGDTSVFATLREAVDARRLVEIDHIGTESDTRRSRSVEPWALFREGGAWYLVGHCRLAVDERVFRVDRIVSATPGDEDIVPPDPLPPRRALRSPDDAPTVVLDLDDDAAWVVESYPVDEVTPLPTGGRRVRLRVVSRPWLERLLLRLGPTARLVEVDPRLGDGDLAAEAARRVLARYGSAADGG